MTTTATATTTPTSPTAASARSAAAAATTTVSVDVADLIRILQVQLPQLHNESEHKVQMEDTKEQYRLLCKETDGLRKKLLAVVQDNNNYRKTQERMESQIYAQQQEIAQAHKETQVLTRQRKHLEKRLENELHNYESDRLLWQQREADLRSEVKRWSVQDRAGQHPRRTRSATASNIWARTSTSLPEPQSWGTRGGSMGTLFEERTKPIDSVAVRDTKIRAQEKLVSDYKSEVEQQERVIHEAMLAAEAQTQRIDTLEKELTSLKEVNASLMEDNESYQILLHEKTMAGEFPKKSDLASTTPSIAAEATIPTAAEAATTTKPETTSLAAELNKVQGGDCACQHAAAVKKLSDEIRVLQESNKALSLYMNKILLKIVDNQELVDVLNIDEDDEISSSPDHPATAAAAAAAAAAVVVAAPSAKREKTTSPPLSSSTAPISIEKTNAAAADNNNNNNNNSNRPRRSTISSWISAPKQPVTGEPTTTVGRHRSHTNNDGTGGGSGTPNNNGSSGGWSRALKRMTVIGWSSKESSSNNSNTHNSYSSTSTITPASHDSAISSCDSVILEE
ncbi:hypothetical protein BDB00DRAFT_872228 [Zychaea mexicana]|uniref:uncharacterized protein n=1 Tax=Zychaea mexicana TaxID=64656 RepID=UPI0022FE71BA|nr:uncharacterized protein BDB00DRAFT_872228 [Zychaea mexicana]KAI9493552.1 hypothetical protein BDB00DRAFT_872228 [Zychaea mexicana]